MKLQVLSFFIFREKTQFLPFAVYNRIKIIFLYRPASTENFISIYYLNMGTILFPDAKQRERKIAFLICIKLYWLNIKLIKSDFAKQLQILF